MEANNLSELCDHILNLLKDGRTLTVKQIMGPEYMKWSFDKRNAYHTAITTMVQKNYLRETSSRYISITPEGQAFIESGGHSGKKSAEVQKRNWKTGSIHCSFDLNEISIDTNLFSMKMGKRQVYMGVASLVVAIAAVIVAAVPIFKSDDSVQMKKLIQQQNQKFDSMVKVQQQIERHLSRITTDTLDLPVQLPSGRNNNLPKSC